MGSKQNTKSVFFIAHASFLETGMLEISNQFVFVY